MSCSWKLLVKKGGCLLMRYSCEDIWNWIKALSEFKIKALGTTIVRTLLENYPPLLETYLQHEENEGDENVDQLIQLPMNPIVSLKCSTWHIVWEVVGAYHLFFVNKLLLHFHTTNVLYICLIFPLCLKVRCLPT